MSNIRPLPSFTPNPSGLQPSPQPQADSASRPTGQLQHQHSGLSARQSAGGPSTNPPQTPRGEPLHPWQAQPQSEFGGSNFGDIQPSDAGRQRSILTSEPGLTPAHPMQVPSEGLHSRALSGSSRPPAADAAAEDSLPHERTRGQPRKRGLLSRMFRTGSRGASTNVPFTLSVTTEGGPTRPDVRGPTPLPIGPVSGAKLAAADVEKLGRATARAVASMGVGERSELVPVHPASRAAMMERTHCATALEKMFKPEAANLEPTVQTQLSTLGQNVLRFADAMGSAGERPFAPALVAGTALHRLTGSDPAQANALLRAADHAQLEGTLEEGMALKLANFERLLAATPTGAKVLCHLRGIHDEAHQEALKDAVNIASEISAHLGRDFGGRNWLQQALAAIDSPEHRLGERIGSPEDAPLQLLGKALRHATAAMAGETSTPGDKAAHLAWQYGFSSSVPGSDFDKTLHQLNDRWSKYVERADHGPRTAGNLAREVGHLVANALGKHKDPLTQTRFGTMGADLRPLDVEQGRFVVTLRRAIAPLRSRMAHELNSPEVLNDPKVMSEVLARMSALEQWDAVGRKSFRVDAHRAFERAQQLHDQLRQQVAESTDPRLAGITVQPISEDAFMRALKVPRKLHRQSAADTRLKDPKVVSLGQKLNLAVLESWARTVRPVTSGDVAIRTEWLKESKAELQQRADLLQSQLGDLVQRLEHQDVPATPLEGHGRPYPDLDATQRQKLLDLEETRLLLLPHHELQAKYNSTTDATPELAHRRQVIEAILVARTDQSVAAARAIAKGREPEVPLFKVKDLLNLATGKTPRPGPSATHAKYVLNQAANHRDESMATFSDGAAHGINLHAVLGLKSGKGAAVVPSVRAEAGKSAKVSTGVSLTGGRFAVTSARSRVIGGGASGAFGYSFGKSVAAAFAEVSGARSSAHNETAAITARNDVDGWETKTGEVVEFMFDQASRRQSKCDFWQNFSDRFGDDRHIAVSWVKDDPSTVSAGAAAGGTLRGGPGAWNVGPSASVGIRRQQQHDHRSVGERMNDVPLAAHSKQTMANANAGFNLGTAPSGVRGGEVGDMLWVSQLAGVSAQKILGGHGAQFAVGRNRHGDMVPREVQRLQFLRDPEKHIAQVNSRREAWEQQGQVSREKINRYIEQVSRLAPQGNLTFGEFVIGRADVIAELNDYEHLRTTLEGRGVRDGALQEMSSDQLAEQQRLKNAIDHALLQDSSWEPIALYGVEGNSVAQAAGINMGLKAAGESSASANRLVTLLVVPPPIESQAVAPPPSRGSSAGGPGTDLPEIAERTTSGSPSTEPGERIDFAVPGVMAQFSPAYGAFEAITQAWVAQHGASTNEAGANRTTVEEALRAFDLVMTESDAGGAASPADSPASRPTTPGEHPSGEK